MYPEKRLEYEVLIFVLAIIGFPLCCCTGVGMIPAGIAFFIANNELKKCYDSNEPYLNQDSIYTGKIIALVVLIINVLYLAYTLYIIYITGWDVLMEQSNEFIEQYK